MPRPVAPRQRLPARVAVIAVSMIASMLPAAPAHAHPPGIQAGVDYRIVVTSLDPPVDGVRVRFVADGSRLELRSDAPDVVEILGYDGEPMLRVSPGGAWQNARAPSLYVGQPGAAAQAGASPGAQPQWLPMSDRGLVRWQDHRTLWHGDRPPQVLGDPGRVHRVLDWQVPARVGSRDARIVGFVEWVPPPGSDGWWLAVLLLVALLTAAGAAARRRPGIGRAVLATAGFAVGMAAAWYQVRVIVDNVEPGAGAFAAALLGRWAPTLFALAVITGGAVAAAGKAVGRYLLAVSGPLLAVAAGLENVALISHSVGPVAVDPVWGRLVEVVVLGGGAGLLGFGLARGRAEAPVELPVAPVHRGPATAS